MTNFLYTVLQNGHRGTLLLWVPTSYPPVHPHLVGDLSNLMTPDKVRKSSTTPWSQGHFL